MPHWQFGTPVIQLRVGDKTLSVPSAMFILNKIDVITMNQNCWINNLYNLWTFMRSTYNPHPIWYKNCVSYGNHKVTLRLNDIMVKFKVLLRLYWHVDETTCVFSLNSFRFCTTAIFSICFSWSYGNKTLLLLLLNIASALLFLFPLFSVHRLRMIDIVHFILYRYPNNNVSAIVASCILQL